MKEYCLNKECALADKCLRIIKLKDETHYTISVLNPAIVSGGAGCQYFISKDPIRFGKGFIKMLDELSLKKADEFRSRMIAHYPRNKYFKMRKGEILCSPDDQQFISNLLAELSISCDNIFDEWVEQANW